MLDGQPGEIVTADAEIESRTEAGQGGGGLKGVAGDREGGVVGITCAGDKLIAVSVGGIGVLGGEVGDG